MINLFNRKIFTTEETKKEISKHSIYALANVLPIGSGIRWFESESSPIPEGWIKAGTDISDKNTFDSRYDSLREKYGDVLPNEDNTIFLAFYKEQ